MPLPTPDEIKKGYDIGKKFVELWGRVNEYLRGSKQRVMFTGMEGVGKSVLFDYMRGEAYKSGYTPPGKSQSTERGRLASRSGGVGLLVLPGQASAPRWETAQGTILGKNPPVGIIHVVANGFASHRGTETTDTIRELTAARTLAQFRKLQREEELNELRQVCGWVRHAHRIHRRPSWLVLAVTKYDLFAQDTTLTDSYFPGGHGVSVAALDELTKQVGSDNFRWQAAKVCGSLEPFVRRSVTVESELDASQRDGLVEELVKLVLEFCQPGGRA